jgi:LemA protein
MLPLVASAVGVLLLVWAVYTYNFLVHSRNKVNESLSGVDVHLKARHDLVPNLVETVRAYAEHEQVVLRETSAARAKAISAETMGDVSHAENRLAARITGVVALQEDYPDLAASAQFTQLIEELAEVENEVLAARNLYNSNVEFHNSKAQSFPAMIVAMFFKQPIYDFLRFDTVELKPVVLQTEGFAA